MANNEPDVINMDGKDLSEYAGRGVLADLEQDEAASVVNFPINHPAANKIQLVNRGVPSSPAAVAAMGAGLI